MMQIVPCCWGRAAVIWKRPSLLPVASRKELAKNKLRRFGFSPSTKAHKEEETGIVLGYLEPGASFAIFCRETSTRASSLF